MMDFKNHSEPWEHTTTYHTSGTSDRFEASSSVALTSEVGDPSSAVEA
jgi:hypothetical protein